MMEGDPIFQGGGAFPHRSGKTTIIEAALAHAQKAGAKVMVVKPGATEQEQRILAEHQQQEDLKEKRRRRDLLVEAARESGLSDRKFATRMLGRDERTFRTWKEARQMIPDAAMPLIEGIVADQRARQQRKLRQRFDPHVTSSPRPATDAEFQIALDESHAKRKAAADRRARRAEKRRKT